MDHIINAGNRQERKYRIVINAPIIVIVDELMGDKPLGIVDVPPLIIISFEDEADRKQVSGGQRDRANQDEAGEGGKKPGRGRK